MVSVNGKTYIYSYLYHSIITQVQATISCNPCFFLFKATKITIIINTSPKTEFINSADIY